ncbi:hypothetical protein ACN47E_008221 [Coniothyrium glycines]
MPDNRTVNELLDERETLLRAISRRLREMTAIRRRRAARASTLLAHHNALIIDVRRSLQLNQAIERAIARTIALHAWWRTMDPEEQRRQLFWAIERSMRNKPRG